MGLVHNIIVCNAHLNALLCINSYKKPEYYIHEKVDKGTIGNKKFIASEV